MDRVPVNRTTPDTRQSVITHIQAQTLQDLFRARVLISHADIAYREHYPATNTWRDITWSEAGTRVARIQQALDRERLNPGDRIAIMLRNCPDWLFFEQAALGLGLVVVPLYTNDRPHNVAYMLQDAGVKVLLVEGPMQLKALSTITSQLNGLTRLISLQSGKTDLDIPRLASLEDWLPQGSFTLQTFAAKPDDLATIVYTSGTTGYPKGVMLSHRNILFNARAAIESFPVYHDDLFLSFLPLSHMMERTLGYYIPMLTGATVAFARSVQTLAEDLLSVQPTILISVPRIYDRFYEKIHGQLREKSMLARLLFKYTVACGWKKATQRKSPAWPLLERLIARKIMAKLGGRIRLAICGGAPMSLQVGRTFMGLGLNLIQGYGLTETSPIICGNRADDNEPASVGTPLNGIEIKVGANEELLTRSPSVMLGYWNNLAATREAIDPDGWFHTGDQVKMENGRIYITGRIKDIIVLSTGKKVSPMDMEIELAAHPLVEQIMIVGESRAYLSALAVLNRDQWEVVCAELNLDPDAPHSLREPAAQRAVLKQIGTQLRNFPKHAQVKRIWLTLEPWTMENGFITPTLKLRRTHVLQYFKDIVDDLYKEPARHS